ncbi:MAG: PKD domain-containing protein [Bacteroidetes bacterium]|nr:PKD domain-containing protein [Bacteroidota bacterium]
MKNYSISSCIIVSLLLLGNSNTSQAQSFGFFATPVIGCPPLEVTITNTLTDTNAYRYDWAFGDGTPIFVDTLTTSLNHTFLQPGYYYIYLYVYDSLGNYLGYYSSSNGGIRVLGSIDFAPPDSVCPGDNTQIWGNWDATSWFWDFGDGNSGSSSYYYTYHVFSAPGTYDITLIQGSAYCTDTTVMQIIVSNNAQPNAVFYSNPPTPDVCPGDPIRFYPNYYYGTHFWDFGDSVTSTNANYVDHPYDSTGTYTVTHIITNSCGYTDTATMTINVTNNNLVTGSQYLNIYPGTTVCPNTTLSFNATSGYSSYIWSFGDGTPDDTTTTYYISHGYYSLGVYPVSVRILNGCGNDTVLNNTINVVNTGGFGPLSFYTNYSPSCPGDGVTLSASGGYAQYAWNYGDGTAYITQGSSSGSSHIYQYTGSYSVSVTIYNSCGADTTLYKTLNISGSAPFSGSFYFNANPTNSIACTGHDVQFFTRGGFTNYIWDFGDGTPPLSSTASSFYHTYYYPGNFTAIVTIVNGCGVDSTLSKNITITDSTTFPNTPSFKINGSFNSVCPNTKVLFSPPTGYSNYLWDFGDGTPLLNAPSSNQPHYYSDTGTYNITLVITNHCGFDTTLTASVVVTNNAGISSAPSVTVNPAPACTGQEISFSNNSQFPFYTWDFGDGVIDSVTNSRWAYHTYSQSGVYHYSLTYKNLCNQAKTTIGEITIDSNLPIPSYATLLINSTPACPGQEISLATVPGMLSYVWNFGDGSPLLNNTLSTVSYLFSDTGTFPVSVSLTNYCGNSALLNDTIIIGSDVGFLSDLSMTVSPVPACPGDVVNITTNSGYASYLWNFGDSTSATGASTAVHSYDSTGNYVASVTILNHCGIDTIISTPVVIDTGLTPALGRMQNSVSSACPGENISFWAENTTFNLYRWVFGDGDTVFTTGSTIEHAYDSVGNYITSLTVFNSCGNSKSNFGSILITDDIQVPQLSVLPSSNTACTGDAVQFIAGGGSSSYQYIWNFGDGITDTVIGSATSHSYSDTGTYMVQLIAINPCGNSALFDTVISITDSLTTQFASGEEWGISNGSNIAGCPGDVVLFFFRGTGNNLWDFGDGYTDVATEQFIVDQGYIITIIKHAYSDTGTYLVKFTYTNGCGISTTDSMNIIIGNNFLVNGDLLIEEPITQGGYTTCKPINFVGVGGETYFWDFGDGDTVTSINPAVSHQYLAEGNYSVTVKITNGCSNTILLSRTVNVFDVSGLTVNTAISSPVTCYNGSDGTISASASGGQSPYSYLWSDALSQTTSVAVNLIPGTYDVTVTDNIGCGVTGSVTLVNPSPIVLTDTTAPASCGNNDGSSTIYVTSGGNAPFSYLWSDFTNGQSNTTLSAGTYSVTVTDATGCTSSRIIAVNETGAPVISLSSVGTVNCYGGNNGSIGITVTGGFAPYTYNWSNGTTLEDISSLAAGTYILTLTDSTGCQSSLVAEVTQPPPVSVSFAVIGTNCGTSNGSATAIAGGGVSPYSYLWDDSQTTQTATGLPAGTFMITVTDANVCTTTGIASVSNTNAPVITSTINNATCYGLSNGSVLQSITGGTTPYQRSWSSGEQSNNIYNKPAGNYICYITDASGCITVRNYSVTQPALLTASATASTATCGNNDGTASVAVSGGTSPYSYTWTGGATTSLATALAGGNYTVTITDSKGCDTTASVPVTVTAQPHSICVVTVDSATNKNLIAWEKTPGLSTSRYYIFKEIFTNVYDTIGFVPYDSISYFIDYASAPNTKSERYKIATLDSCGNFSMLSDSHRTMLLQVNLGAQDQRNLSWQNYEGFTAPQYRIWRGTTSSNIALIDSVVSTNTAYNDWDTLAGADSLFYVVEIVHPTGCTSTLKIKTYNSSKSNTASMEAPSLGITLSMSATDVTCNTGTNGTATVIESGGTGPFSYLWNDPSSQSTQTATGLTAGNYIVTVTDSKAITAADTITITEPPVISISVSSTPDTCSSGDGTASASATGGTGGFSYAWSSGQSNSVSTGLAAATYTVTATDNSGCPFQNSVVVNALNISLAVSTTVTDATCNNSDGTATAAAGGGTGGYNYVWSNSQSADAATGLAPATYTVTATDGSGCTGTTSASVSSVNVPLNLLSTSTAVSCYGGSNGSATVLPASGVSPFTYLWDSSAGNQTNATAMGLSADTFNVTVTDSKGCFGTQSVTVTEPAQITLSVSTVTPTCGNTDGSATATAGGGTGTLTYLWSNGQSNSTATSLLVGNYTVSITDGNNCTVSATASVSDANAPVLSQSSTPVTCNGDGDGTATVGITGGSPPYTIQWDSSAGNQTTSTATGLSGGNYSIQVTDSAGCNAFSNVTVTEPASLALAVDTIIDATSPGNNDGEIQITVSGGTGAYTYLWSNSETTEDISGLSAATYSVTVTDANNCQAVYTDTVKLITGLPVASNNTILTAFPNPYKKLTTLVYYLPAESFVTVNVYNLFGMKIYELYKGPESAGIHERGFSAAAIGYAEGIYLIRLKTDFGETAIRVIELK